MSSNEAVSATVQSDVFQLSKIRAEIQRVTKEEPLAFDYLSSLLQWESKWCEWVLESQKEFGLKPDIHPCVIAQYQKKQCPWEPVSKCSLCWWLK